ncbi:MAG TPA: lactate 2-monooxygenase [Candidatus Acidoferrales bacterium]|jgi:isopentenyl diphosphate isomerase/L-lactate dehydrogenase-like FMN-dependent dehydrogenase|nr:lactate 2-monooxygenase [Candidatus Acidoferrales bacterium]
MTEKPKAMIFRGDLREQEIYQGGLMGNRISVPVQLSLLEQRAKEALSPQAWDYVAGGAGGEETIRANREAFERWKLVPRMLCNVAERDLRMEILGRKLPAPVLLGPVGVQGIIHKGAETETARAAASLGIPMVLSTVSSRPMEEIARANGDGTRWFQLYWSKDRELTASFLRRAESAGFSALVVTLDIPILGWRERDLEYPFLPFLLGEGLANYFSDPVFRSRLAKPPEEDPIGAIKKWSEVFANPALTWDDLKFLRQHTKLPILLKGILHAEDAAKALDFGAEGLIVSNHGGRQVDGAIAALDALPKVVEVVKGRAPVLFDSGIRRGADAVKALALGARAVLLGRLYIYGLAVAGEQGVRDVVQNFLADLDITLGLCGCKSVGELYPELLARQ